jgi:hypothetical protein
METDITLISFHPEICLGTEEYREKRSILFVSESGVGKHEPSRVRTVMLYTAQPALRTAAVGMHVSSTRSRELCSSWAHYVYSQDMTSSV